MSVDFIAPADEMVRHELDSLEASLVEEFCPPLDPVEVRRRCAEAIASLGSAEIHSYIVVLAEHDVRQKLRQMRDQTTATSGGRS
jgi:hypothetical protein